MVMQAKATLILAVLLSAGWSAQLGAQDHSPTEQSRPDGERDRDRNRPDRPGRHDGPSIIIEPNIDLSRRQKPNVDEPRFIMAELEQCVAQGIRLFVDCLRANHSSVMIRRLEACLRSETIPDDPRRIPACLPPPSLR
jgi:hypothetical protein